MNQALAERISFWKAEETFTVSRRRFAISDLSCPAGHATLQRSMLLLTFHCHWRDILSDLFLMEQRENDQEKLITSWGCQTFKWTFHATLLMDTSNNMIDGNEMLTHESFQALKSDYNAKSQLSCGSCIRKTKADPQRANEAIGKICTNQHHWPEINNSRKQPRTENGSLESLMSGRCVRLRVELATCNLANMSERINHGEYACLPASRLLRSSSFASTICFSWSITSCTCPNSLLLCRISSRPNKICKEHDISRV